MTNGQMQGYRWLHLRAVQQGFVVSQDTIRSIIKLADPQGVEIRQARRLRRQINLFQTFQDDGHFTGDFLDKSLIQFCFLNLVQAELDEVVNTWNSHKIRPRSRGDVASGRPVVMYSFPELHSAEDRLKPITMEEITLCMEECTPKGQFPCNELCCVLMEENGWDAPVDLLAAADLYFNLREEIHQNI
ncbi:hypothetical protein GBF38_022176 [Nibea albiflora]|uniref:Uncharacterized protein n=1 Tax=Nibea albiflora TaxID=240163 RepID=A0ACB7FHE7_NIBAL|nr:hypothetical protein GBF38_022176 [Nibea albiflora]